MIGKNLLLAKVVLICTITLSANVETAVVAFVKVVGGDS